MAKGEIQSVEVSCFIHATEDAAKVTRSIADVLSLETPPEEEVLEGHFGNEIIHAKWHLTGDAAQAAFLAASEFIGEAGRSEILRDMSSMSDEHGALYLRLNKQMLVKGKALFSLSDPVRVKVKPRRFMMRGTAEEFYERLLGRGTR